MEGRIVPDRLATDYGAVYSQARRRLHHPMDRRRSVQVPRMATIPRRQADLTSFRLFSPDRIASSTHPIDFTDRSIWHGTCYMQGRT